MGSFFDSSKRLFEFKDEKTGCFYKGEGILKGKIKHGKGVLKCPDGRCYEGTWVNDS